MNRENLLHVPSAAFTALENFLYARKKTEIDAPLRDDGFLLLQKNFATFAAIKPQQYIGRNPYLDVAIYERADLSNIAKEILECREIRNVLFSTFGMQFSIDFVYSSQTKPIPNDNRGEGYFANHFHRDLLFSYNTVKIFVALEQIEENQGPTEWLSRPDSESVLAKGFERSNAEQLTADTKVHKFTGAIGASMMLLPRSNIHKAGVPNAGQTRRQMMFQLNPARNWSIHSDLYQRQFAGEPNLPLFRNSFRRHQVTSMSI
jgi:hypothetical protein